MIKLEPIQRSGNPRQDQHFILRSDEPVRVEVRVDMNGRAHAFVYRGTEDNPHQEPIGAFDGTLIHGNVEWEV